MKTYLFLTSATMKKHNEDKYWIDRKAISPIEFDADSIAHAIQRYAKYVQDNHFVSISKHALTHKEPMYVDKQDGTTQQTGYVITGKTAFDYDRKYTEQYINLWVRVYNPVQFNSSPSKRNNQYGTIPQRRKT